MTLNWKDYRFLMLTIIAIGIGLLLSESIAAIVITGIFVAYAWIRPKNGLLVLLFYTPIRPFLVEVNPGLKWIGDVIILVVLAKVLLEAVKTDWKSIFRLKVWEWAYLAFIIFGSIVAFGSGVSIAAIIFQIRKFLIMYLLYYIVSRLNITKADIYRFAWTTIFTAVIISLHGIIEKISGRQWLLPEAWSQKVLSATNAIRVYGLTGNPNSLALFMAISIVVVALLISYESKKGRGWLQAALVLFSGMLFLSYSRGTWIAIVMFVLIYLLLNRDWQFLKRMAISAILGFALIYLPVNAAPALIENLGINVSDGGSGEGSKLGGRLSETFDDETLELSRNNGRIFYIKKGFEVFMDHPITGTGFATFGDSATLVYSSPIYKHYGIRSDIYGGKDFYSDNQYIQVIAQNGVIGVVLFAIFLLGMLYEMWKKRKKNKASYMMIAFWIATGVSGLYYNIWELKLYTMYYFLIFGAFQVWSYKKETKTNEQ